MQIVELTPEERRRRTHGVAALLVVQLFFGLFPLFGKRAFPHFAASAVAGWRIAVGATVLGLLALALHGRKALLARADVPRVLLCGLLGVVLNMALFLEGLQRSTAVNSALLLPLIPVFTAIVAVVLREERFDRVRAFGMAVAFAGASLILFGHTGGLDAGHTTGNLLIVANEICYAIYLVIARPLLQRYPPLVLTAWVFVASAWGIPFLFGSEAPPVPQAAPASAWWALLYIVVFPTILTYLLNAFALARVSASTTAAFIFIQPMITVLGALLWLGEGLPENFLIATLLTFGGVWVVARRPAVRPVAPLPSAD